MTTVLFGINALEAEIVESGTYQNLTLKRNGRLEIPDELPLHTEVLWPSIITGVKPSVHGLTRTTAREWESPALELAAQVGTSIFPEKYLLPIGKRIQKLGFGREDKSGAEHFKQVGLDTIFTGVPSVDIDVPGYSEREGTDEVRELMGHDEYEPRDESLFLEKIEDEFADKRERLLKSLSSDVDLYVCYFQALDNFQHVYWNDEAAVREWYDRFDTLVGEVRNKVSDQDTVIVMSDHGMREGEDGKGEHSAHGYYASTSDIHMETILDLKDKIDNEIKR